MLELTQKPERVRFVSSPLLITRLVLFQIHLWDKRYFRLVGFLFCSEYQSNAPVNNRILKFSEAVGVAVGEPNLKNIIFCFGIDDEG